LKLILLVDDSKFVRLSTEKALIRAGYADVTAVADSAGGQSRHHPVGHVATKTQRVRSSPSAEDQSSYRGYSQKNEAKLMKDDAAAYFEKSRLDMYQKPETLLELVKKTLDGLAGRTVSEIPPQREPRTSVLAVIAGSYSQ
jgi:hypothetical protein